jgi:glucose/arabinose dehydrogenase
MLGPSSPEASRSPFYAGGDSTPMQRADNKEGMTISGGTFTMPRLIRSAPNGDLFLADSGAGTIFILRGVGPHGKAEQIEKFATALDHPFGIAFYPADDPQFVYVGNATTVQRIPYHSGNLHSTTAPETIVPDIPRLRPTHRWRSLDPRRGLHERRSTLACLRGLGSNLDDPDTHPKGVHRADVLGGIAGRRYATCAGLMSLR